MKRAPSPALGRAAPSASPPQRAPSPQPTNRAKPPTTAAGTLPGVGHIPALTTDTVRRRLALQDCSNVPDDLRGKKSGGTPREAAKPEQRATPRRGRPGTAAAPPGPPQAVRVMPSTEVRFLLSVGDEVWAAERDGPITVRDAQSSEVRDVLGVAGAHFCWCLLLCEGHVWAGFSGGHLRVYHAETHALVRELLQHAGGVYALAYSGGHVYSGSNDFECFRWHCQRLEFVRQYSGHKNSVRSVLAFGCTLVTGSDDHTIRIWDILTGAVLRELAGHHGGVLALLRAGGRLWSASEDGTLRVWDVESGRHLHSIADHTGRITCLVKAGQQVLSSGVDRSIYAYHAESFKRTGLFAEHEGYINHAAVVGRSVQYTVWSCSSDRTLRAWKFESPYNPDSESAGASAAEVQALSQALEGQCAALQGRLQAMETEHGAALRERDQRVTELQKALAQAEQRCVERDALIGTLEDRLSEERKATARLRQEGEALRTELQRREAAAEAQRLQQAQEALAVQQRLREGEQRAAAQGTELERQQRAAERLQAELQDARALLLRTEAERADLQGQCQALRTQADIAAKTKGELQALTEKLKAEVARKEQELARAGEAEALARREAGTRCARLAELADLAVLERQRCDRAEAEVAAGQKRESALLQKLHTTEEQLRQHEAFLKAAMQNATELDGRLQELQAERLADVKKESEFEFVIQSRSELVKQIWDLFCGIGDAKKQYRQLLACPSLRALTQPRDQQRLEAVMTGLTAAKDRNRRIICNYFTEVEKFHVGISPYFFPPDEDSGRYRVLENNLEALRRLGLHDLRRTAVLTHVREKASSRRSSSVPPGKVTSGSDSPEPDLAQGYANAGDAIRARRAPSPGPCTSPAPKTRHGTPVRDKPGSRSRSPRF